MCLVEKPRNEDNQLPYEMEQFIPALATLLKKRGFEDEEVKEVRDLLEAKTKVNSDPVGPQTMASDLILYTRFDVWQEIFSEASIGIGVEGNKLKATLYSTGTVRNGKPELTSADIIEAFKNTPANELEAWTKGELRKDTVIGMLKKHLLVSLYGSTLSSDFDGVPNDGMDSVVAVLTSLLVENYYTIDVASDRWSLPYGRHLNIFDELNTRRIQDIIYPEILIKDGKSMASSGVEVLRNFNSIFSKLKKGNNQILSKICGPKSIDGTSNRFSPEQFVGTKANSGAMGKSQSIVCWIDPRLVWQKFHIPTSVKNCEILYAQNQRLPNSNFRETVPGAFYAEELLEMIRRLSEENKSLRYHHILFKKGVNGSEDHYLLKRKQYGSNKIDLNSGKDLYFTNNRFHAVVGQATHNLFERIFAIMDKEVKRIANEKARDAKEVLLASKAFGEAVIKERSKKPVRPKIIIRQNYSD